MISEVEEENFTGIEEVSEENKFRIAEVEEKNFGVAEVPSDNEDEEKLFGVAEVNEENRTGIEEINEEYEFRIAEIEEDSHYGIAEVNEDHGLGITKIVENKSGTEEMDEDVVRTEKPKSKKENEKIIHKDEEEDGDTSEDDIERELLKKRRKEKPSILNSIFSKLMTFLVSSFAFNVVIFGFSYLFSYLFLLPYCGLLFRCGCTFLWLGGVSNCNINNPHAQHKCPWCVAPKSTAWLVNWGTPIISTIGSYLFCLILTMVILIRKRGSLYLIRTALNYNILTKVIGWTSFYLFNGIIFSIVSFAFYGLILGLVFKFATGYPYFLFIKEHP